MFGPLILAVLLCTSFCFSETEVEGKLNARFFTPAITSVEMVDWKHPTVEDFWKLQCFMKARHVINIEEFSKNSIANGPFPSDLLNTEFYGWLLYRSGRIGLVKNEKEMAGREVIYFNGDRDKKDRCVICYAGYPSSWNGRDYARGVSTMIDALKKTGFDGHFIYYVGGWPSLENDRLRYVDVPFAFKPFLFEEVKNLGYQTVLWLDACCIPVKSLDPVFDYIQQKGICFYSYGDLQNWREFISGYAYLMPFLPIFKGGQYEQISSQVVGLDLSNSKACDLLNGWIQAAERRIPFLQSDEPPFMYLVNHLGLQYGRMPKSFYVETPCNTGDFCYWHVNKDAIIYHQYDFVHSKYSVPEDLFDH